MKVKTIGFFLIVIITGLFACKNNADVYPTQLTTNLNVINATSDTLNYYLNGTRINNTSNLYPAGATGYLNVATLGLNKTENYQFKKPSTTTVLLNVPLQLDSNKVYSLFVTGTSSLQGFATRDTIFTDTAQNTSLVRIVNASVDAGNLDVLVDSLKFANRPFKSVTVFSLIGSGTKTVSVYKTGSSTLLYSIPVILQSNNSYTLFSQGSISGTGANAFSIGTMVNQ